MSETTPQPLLFRMGLTVGQSIAGAANQVKEEVLTQVEQEVTTINQQIEQEVTAINQQIEQEVTAINQQINDLPDPVALSLVFGS